MDISRLKKVLAGVSVAAITLAQVSTAFASYGDVASGVWFADAVKAFTDAGYLDTAQANFRPNDNANRAEFAKLVVELNGGILSTPPAVATFNDVKASAWYYGYMEEAAKEGWVKGDNNCAGTHPCYARPGANINRAEAAALIVRAFSLEATSAAPQFVDNPSGQWYTDAIQTAADHCVLQGDDATGRVRPGDNMNRAEMVVMLHRVDQGLTFGTDCGKSQPPAGTAGIKAATAVAAVTVDVDFTTKVDQASAETAGNYKVTAGTVQVTVTAAKLTGDHTAELTLASALDSSLTYTVAVAGVMTSDGKTFADSATFKGFSALPKGTGVLEVSVSSKNPVGDSVPKGAQGVSMVSLDLTASCDDSVSINDLTVLHEGFGKTADIDGLYAEIAGARVSRKRTIDSKDQVATLHFTQPVQVAACKTVTLDLVSDISTTADTSAEHNIVVELPSDVMSNAKEVKGSFPLRGNTFRVAAVAAGTVTVDYRTVSPESVKVGDTAAPIGKFQLATSSTEDDTVYSMTLQQNGTVHDGDLKNLKIIRSDGTVLTNALDTTKGQYATFVFNPPFIVKQGDKVTLTVIADIIGGAKNNIQIQFEESSDVFAVGSLYGYGVNGQLYGAQINITTSATPTTVTVDAGQFSISINGPAQMTYTRDQTDAVLANVDFTAGTEKIDIRHIYIAVQGNTSTGGTLDSNNTSSYNEIKEVLQNVSLKDQTTGRSINGVRLTGSSDSGQATNGTSSATTTGTFQIYRFDDFTITGASHYQLDVDFIDNNSGNSPKSGDQYKIQICGEPQQLSTGANTVGCTFGGLIAISKTYQMQVEGLTTGDSVTDVRPRGTISGNAQRIATANLTVAVKGIGSVDTAVKNAKNVNLFRFEARAGEAKDILFTKAIVVAGVVANGVGAASQAGSINGSGSLVNGQNYSLWVDTDSNGIVDTIVDKGETAQSNKVTFGRLTGGGFVIPKQKTVVFEIHSDISASLTNNWLQIGFSTGDTYIEAEDVVRGSSLSGIKTDASNCTGTCDTTVTTTASKAYKLVSQGDLYVTVDTVPVKNRMLLGGLLGDSVFRLLMHSENEGIDVTDLQFTSSGGTATSVDHLELYFDGQTTPFTTATIGGCGNDAARKYYGTGATNVNTNYSGTASAFCAKMQEHELVVPKGADVKVLVKPWLKTDVNGATPNQSIQFFLDATRASNNATGSGAVRARGVDSSNNLSANDGNSTNNGEVFIGTATAASTNTLIRGLRSVSVLSKIQAITNAGPDTSVVPTGVSDLGQFKISAVTHANSQNGLNKVTLSGVIFNVTATNITLDYTAFLFYNKANSTVTSACTALNTSGTPLLQNASGSFLVDCPRLTASAVNTTIDPGTDGTIVLRGTVVNPKIASTNSTMQVSLQSFDSISRTTFSPTTSHFEWTDKDNGTATTATFQWVEYSDTTVKSTNFQG